MHSQVSALKYREARKVTCLRSVLGERASDITQTAHLPEAACTWALPALVQLDSRSTCYPNQLAEAALLDDYVFADDQAVGCHLA